jgi:hypothetical protein
MPGVNMRQTNKSDSEKQFIAKPELEPPKLSCNCEICHKCISCGNCKCKEPMPFYEQEEIDEYIKSVEAVIKWHEDEKQEIMYEIQNILLLPIESPAKDKLQNLLIAMGWQSK